MPGDMLELHVTVIARPRQDLEVHAARRGSGHALAEAVFAAMILAPDEASAKG